MIDGEAELVFRIGSLVITLKGPAGEVARAQPLIAASLRSSSPPPVSRASSGFSLVDPPEIASASTDVGSSARRSSAPPETRGDVAASFLPLPDRWARQAHQAHQLHSSVCSGESRLQRAWLAGNWAGAVLNGRIGTPAHSPVVKLPARFYVVLRAQGLRAPVLVTTSSAYFDIVGRPFNPQSLSHSFASLLEVRVYCDAAGVAVPEQQ